MKTFATLAVVLCLSGAYADGIAAGIPFTGSEAYTTEHCEGGNGSHRFGDSSHGCWIAYEAPVGANDCARIITSVQVGCRNDGRTDHCSVLHEQLASCVW